MMARSLEILVPGNKFGDVEREWMESIAWQLGYSVLCEESSRDSYIAKALQTVLDILSHYDSDVRVLKKIDAAIRNYLEDYSSQRPVPIGPLTLEQERMMRMSIVKRLHNLCLEEKKIMREADFSLNLGGLDTRIEEHIYCEMYKRPPAGHVGLTRDPSPWNENAVRALEG